MKKLMLLLAAFAVAVCFVSCSDDDEVIGDNDDEQVQGPNTDSDDGSGSGGSTTTGGDEITVSLSVTGLADNQATVSISLTSGEFHGGKLVEAVSTSEITFDPDTDEDALIAYVAENGVDIDKLPYEKTLTDLETGAEMLTAVIVYDEGGEVADTSCEIWTVEGEPEPDPEPEPEPEEITVFLSVTDIADNQATVSISLTSGEFHGGKLVEAVSTSEITFDPDTDEDALIAYVAENGVDIDKLPYEKTLTGLKADSVMLTAVIVYDADGNVADTGYEKWTVVGLPDTFVPGGDPGDLGEHEW